MCASPNTQALAQQRSNFFRQTTVEILFPAHHYLRQYVCDALSALLTRVALALAIPIMWMNGPVTVRADPFALSLSLGSGRRRRGHLGIAELAVVQVVRTGPPSRSTDLVKISKKTMDKPLRHLRVSLHDVLMMFSIVESSEPLR
jgi:hypothetical protein